MVQELSASQIGARMLGEVEEVGLDEVLATLRTVITSITTTTTTTNNNNDNDNDNNNENNAHTTNAVLQRYNINHGPRLFPIPGLNVLVQRHFTDVTRNSTGGGTQAPPPLAICGRYQELLYPLIATLIAPPWEKTVSVVDFDGRFDAVRLMVTSPVREPGVMEEHLRPRRGDLEHVYVWSPNRGYEGDVYGEIERFMLYGDHGSRDREWWGTVMIGTGLGRAAVIKSRSAHVAVTAGRGGWLRVDRAEVRGFGGKGVERALRERDERQAAVEGAGWVGSSAWGEFVFGNK